MTYIKTPLRTPGGKSKALGFLIPHIPPHETYIECFLGGGSVFLRMAQLYPDRNYIVNDLQYAIYAFWNTLYNSPNELMKFILEQRNSCENEEDGRILHASSRKEISIVDGKDEFLTACYYYILNKTSFSGLTRIGSYAPMAFKSNFSIRCIKNLSKVSELMHSVKSLKITNLDYSELLKNATQNIFIFLDPPYNIKDNLYGNEGDMHREFDHKAFADEIKQCKHKWMITYNDKETIRQWFDKYQCIPWNLQYTMKAAKRTETGNLMTEAIKDGRMNTTLKQSKNAKSDKSGKKGKELLIKNYV